MSIEYVLLRLAEYSADACRSLGRACPGDPMATIESELRAKMYLSQEAPRERHAEIPGKVELPAGTEIVSADCHWSVSQDIWYENFPAHLKSRAPRVWLDRGCWVIGFNEKSVVPGNFVTAMAEYDERPGSYNLTARLEDLDREGISQEIVFGNLAFALFRYSDFEVREWLWRVYNQHLADIGRQSGGRFHGVGVLPNWWDMSKARQSVQEVCDLGLKTFLLPQNPGKFPDGRDINYAEAEMAPLWSAIEDSGLPVCFHIGESYKSGAGGMGTLALVNFGGFREQLGPLIFGGVFDRHPRLKVVFVEAGITWAVNAIRDADFIHAAHHRTLDALDTKIKHPPRYYWDNHCYTTFIMDSIGLGLLEHVGGPDHVLWSSDYPHNESSLGFGWQSVQDVLEHVSPANARKILGDNARKLFKLESRLAR
jgi:predicted TIM-barrel fold metal-dependent hydrolase